ncbi:MAG: FAD-dependent oxidoreductase [bacterium]
MADYLIIGNGAAGRKAAENIRNKNSAASVVMITDEPFPFYPRPRLSLGYISGDTARDAMFAVPDFYSKNAVSLLFGAVTAVKPAENLILLADGSSLSYNALLIASGASAVIPPWEGGNLDGVVTLRTMADADNILKRLESVEMAVVAGGGILGCEVAEAINKRGRKTCILVRGGKDKVGAPALVPEKAVARCESMISSGIDVLIDEEVGRLNGSGKLEEVVTASGKTIKTSLVICTIGARANIGFLADSGIKTNRGVIVNAELASPDFPNIFAAGDAAEPTGDGSEKQRYGSPYINAMKQGEYAAGRMLAI